MLKCLLFISFDHPSRLWRLNSILKKYSRRLEFYLYLVPKDASAGMLQAAGMMTDIVIKPMERENFEGFDIYYVDLSVEHLKEWGKELLKKVPSQTQTIQFIDVLQLEYFIGDVIILPGLYNKMEINRQMHKLIRFGIIKNTEELGDHNLHYSGKGRIHIFIGPGFYSDRQSLPPVTRTDSGKVYFANELVSGFENQVLKILTRLSGCTGIRELKIANTPLMNDRERKRFDGLVAFLRASSVKVTVMQMKELYEEVFSEGFSGGGTILLTDHGDAPHLIFRTPLFLVGKPFWSRFPEGLVCGHQVCGAATVNEDSLDEFLKNCLEGTAGKIPGNEADHFSKITEIIDSVVNG